jgi:hypothetical protein
MRRIHVYAVSVLAILVLAVGPAFGATIYKFHDDSAEDAIFSTEIGGAIMTQFVHTAAARFLGVRVNVQDVTPFELLVTDDGPTCPGAVLYSTAAAAAAPGWTEFYRIPRGTPIATGDVVYAGVGYQVASAPAVSLDLGSSGNTVAVEPSTHCDPVTGEALIEAVAARMGDLNGDGDVDTGDALAAVNIFLGVNPLDAMAKLIGDANVDNTVDTADALAFIGVFLGTKPEGELP